MPMPRTALSLVASFMLLCVCFLAPRAWAQNMANPPPPSENAAQPTANATEPLAQELSPVFGAAPGAGGSERNASGASGGSGAGQRDNAPYPGYQRLEKPDWPSWLRFGKVKLLPREGGRQLINVAGREAGLSLNLSGPVAFSSVWSGPAAEPPQTTNATAEIATVALSEAAPTYFIELPNPLLPGGRGLLAVSPEAVDLGSTLSLDATTLPELREAMVRVRKDHGASAQTSLETSPSIQAMAKELMRQALARTDLVEAEQANILADYQAFEASAGALVLRLGGGVLVLDGSNAYTTLYNGTEIPPAQNADGLSGAARAYLAMRANEAQLHALRSAQDPEQAAELLGSMELGELVPDLGSLTREEGTASIYPEPGWTFTLLGGRFDGYEVHVSETGHRAAPVYLLEPDGSVLSPKGLHERYFLATAQTAHPETKPAGSGDRGALPALFGLEARLELPPVGGPEYSARGKWIKGDLVFSAGPVAVAPGELRTIYGDLDLGPATRLEAPGPLTLHGELLATSATHLDLSGLERVLALDLTPSRIAVLNLPERTRVDELRAVATPVSPGTSFETRLGEVFLYTAERTLIRLTPADTERLPLGADEKRLAPYRPAPDLLTPLPGTPTAAVVSFEPPHVVASQMVTAGIALSGTLRVGQVARRLNEQRITIVADAVYFLLDSGVFAPRHELYDDLLVRYQAGTPYLVQAQQFPAFTPETMLTDLQGFVLSDPRVQEKVRFYLNKGDSKGLYIGLDNVFFHADNPAVPTNGMRIQHQKHPRSRFYRSPRDTSTPERFLEVRANPASGSLTAYLMQGALTEPGGTVLGELKDLTGPAVQQARP